MFGRDALHQDEFDLFSFYYVTPSTSVFSSSSSWKFDKSDLQTRSFLMWTIVYFSSPEGVTSELFAILKWRIKIENRYLERGPTEWINRLTLYKDRRCSFLLARRQASSMLWTVATVNKEKKTLSIWKIVASQSS